MKPVEQAESENSDRSPSGSEKKIYTDPKSDVLVSAHDQLPPDPDVGLSEEEKARIVSRNDLQIDVTDLIGIHRIGGYCGNSISG